MTRGAPIARARRDEPTGGEPSSCAARTDAQLTDELLAPLWTPLAWLRCALVRHRRGHAACSSRRVAYTVITGIGALGQQHPGRLGVRDHQLRLVDRDRPRRHVHLGDPAPARADVAHVDQPLRRGDDALRASCRPGSSRSSTSGGPGSPTGSSPTRRDDGRLAATSEVVAAVGRRRGHARTSRSRSSSGTSGLLPDLAAAARPRADAARGGASTASSRSAGAATPRHWRHYRIALPGPRRPRDAARRSRCTASSASTSRSRSCPGWHSTIFPPYFVAGAIYSGLRDGADADDPGARDLRARERHHRRATSTTWRRCCSSPAGSSPTRTSSRPSSPGTAATATRCTRRSSTGRRRRTRASTGASSSATASRCRSLWSRRVRTSPRRALRGRALRPGRDVVRALHAHRHLAAPRLLAVELARLRRRAGSTGPSSRARSRFFLFLFLLFLRFVPFIPISELKEMRHELRAGEPRAGEARGARLALEGGMRRGRRRVRRARGARARARAAAARSATRASSRGRRTRCAGVGDAAAGVDRAVDHARRRGSPAPRSAYLVAVVVQRLRLPARTSAAARSTPSRRTSRSRSSRACSRRRSRGSSRSSACPGCRACTTRVFEVDGFERASVDRFWIGVDESDPALRRRASATCSRRPGALRCERVGRRRARSEVRTDERARRGAGRARRRRRVPHRADDRDARSAPRTDARSAEGAAPTGRRRSCRTEWRCSRRPTGRCRAERRRSAPTPGRDDGRERRRRTPRAIPIPVDRALLERGARASRRFCAACHGVLGDGASVVAAQMALRKPPSLLVPPRDAPTRPGEVFRDDPRGLRPDAVVRACSSRSTTPGRSSPTCGRCGSRSARASRDLPPDVRERPRAGRPRERLAASIVASLVAGRRRPGARSPSGSASTRRARGSRTSTRGSSA